VAGPMVAGTFAAIQEQFGDDGGVMSGEAMAKMMGSFPLGRLPAFGWGLDREGVDQLIAAANAPQA